MICSKAIWHWEFRGRYPSNQRSSIEPGYPAGCADQTQTTRNNDSTLSADLSNFAGVSWEDDG